MYTLTKRLKFEAAHRIPGHPGKCDRLHGHNYVVDVEVRGTQLDELGILVDFELMKKLGRYLPDHQYLNEVLPHVQPTAEGLSRYFHDLFKLELPEVSAVTVYEGPDAWCRYQEA